MFSKRHGQGQELAGTGAVDASRIGVTALERPSAEARSGGIQPAASAPSRSVIQSDLVIRGAILARGELELHGLVEGDVIARSVVIGPTATIAGDILGERVSISGEVRGKVSGHHVHLGAGARYQGDIRRGTLAIDDGAVFEGSVQALNDAELREIAAQLEAAAPQLSRSGPGSVAAAHHAAPAVTGVSNAAASASQRSFDATTRS